MYSGDLVINDAKCKAFSLFQSCSVSFLSASNYNSCLLNVLIIIICTKVGTRSQLNNTLNGTKKLCWWLVANFRTHLLKLHQWSSEKIQILKIAAENFKATPHQSMQLKRMKTRFREQVAQTSQTEKSTTWAHYYCSLGRYSFCLWCLSLAISIELRIEALFIK